MTLRKNIDKKAYGISQTLGDKSINFMLIFNAKGFSMTVQRNLQYPHEETSGNFDEGLRL